MQELHLSQYIFLIRSHDATFYVHPLDPQIHSCHIQRGLQLVKRNMLAFNELLNCLWSSSDAVWLGISCQCLTIRA